MEQILTWAFNTEHILGASLLLVVLGGGRWFVKQGWPDILTLLRERETIRKQEIEARKVADLEQARLATEAQRVLAERLDALGAAFRDWLAEVRTSIAIQQSHTNLLIHILDKTNGARVSREILEAPTENINSGR